MRAEIGREAEDGRRKAEDEEEGGGGEIRAGKERSSLSPLTRRWSALIPLEFDFELRQLRARFREIIDRARARAKG